MDTTQNYKLNKPSTDDFVDITVLNENADTIDSKLKELADSAEGATATLKAKADLDSTGKVLTEQLPAMDYIPTAQKGAVGGVAELGSDGKVPAGQLPAMDYIPTAQKGAAGGVAELGSDGKVPAGQLPAMEYDAKGAAAAVQTNLDTHTNNTSNPHSVTYDQVGAAAASHTHSGSDLTSAVPISKGGTGATTAADAIKGLDILQPATAQLLGLGAAATPDDMFGVLARSGNIHVWRETVITEAEIPAGYTLGVATKNTVFNATREVWCLASVADSVNVDDAGGVSLNNPATDQKWTKATDWQTNIRGKFVQFGDGSSYVTYVISGIFYIPETATVSGSGLGMVVSEMQFVSGYPLTPAGTTTTYPVSTNPNAYQEGDDAKAAGYVLGDVVTGKFSLGAMYASNGHIIKYADSVTVSDDGTVALSNESSFTVGSSGYSQSQIQTACAGKFIQYYRTSSGATYPPDSIYPFNSTPSAIVFVPSDVSIVTKVYDDYDCYAIDRYQPVTGYAAIPAGTTIEYLGKLGDKARVQILTYVGTGTYGADNANELTFEFAPKIVIISKITADSAPWALFLPPILSETYSRRSYNVIGVTVTQNNSFAKFNKETLSWYSTDGNAPQLNVQSHEYTAIAIG